MHQGIRFGEGLLVYPLVSADALAANDESGFVDVSKAQWVTFLISIGTNDTANVSAGASYTRARAIDEMMKAIDPTATAPVMWVNAFTTLRSGHWSEANMQRWNDKIRPVELRELDKQAHKMVIAYLIGKFEPAFGGSHFSMVTSQAENEPVPDVDKVALDVYKALHRAIHSGIVRAAHDLSEGGLAVAAAEMCIGGRLGLKLESNLWDDYIRLLFGESTGTLLVEVRQQDKQRFLSLFQGLPLAWLGTVTEDQELTMLTHGFSALHVSLSDLLASWNTRL